MPEAVKEYLDKSKYKTHNLSGLVEGYKLFLFMNERQEDYMSRLVYVRKNIPTSEYPMYGVFSQDELIKLLKNLYDDEDFLLNALSNKR